MTATLSRRALLRGRISGQGRYIRPPWSLHETAFVEACSRCDDCLRACGEALIRRGDGGYPIIDFQRGDCTFCGDCVHACERGALSSQSYQSNLPPWQLIPSIDGRCLALQGVICRTCAERCLERAICFRPRIGGVAVPELEGSLCSGCGACVAPCPVSAIALQPADDSVAATSHKQEVSA